MIVATKEYHCLAIEEKMKVTFLKTKLNIVIKRKRDDTSVKNHSWSFKYSVQNDDWVPDSERNQVYN